MKKVVIISLMMILSFYNESHSQIKIIKRNADGGIYKPTLNPGDSVELSGDYSYIDFVANGTPENPIIFFNSGSVAIGKNKNIHYGIRAQGKYFKIISTDVNGQKGIKIGNEVNRIGVLLSLGNSSNYTIDGLELFNTEVALFSNPTSGTLMENVIIKNNYIHDLTHPPSSSSPNPTGPEAIYFGATSGRYDGVRFVNCTIESNIIENTDGDGIQVANGSFIIKNNTIKSFARISRSSHRNGILSGGYATSQIENNIIDGGKGNAITILGGGEMNVTGNTIKNIDLTGLNDDVVYIDGRSGGLKLNFSGNTFSSIKGYRRIIGNYTKSNTPGSLFNNNIGVSKSDVLLLSVDKFNQVVPPVTQPPVIPAKTILKTITLTVYSDGSIDVK